MAARGRCGDSWFMPEKPRFVGINHIALEVGDLEEALAFYGSIFEFELRGRVPRMAFVDMGDQFIAFFEGGSTAPDEERHFGLVVDDLEAAGAALKAAGVETFPGRGINFRDPWGNYVQVVDYRNIQFTKTPEVLRSMGLNGIAKREQALAELRDKGLV